MCKHSLFLVCKKQFDSAFKEFAALNVDVGCLIHLFSSRNWERCTLIAPADCRIWRWWRRRQRGIVNKSILRNVLATWGVWKFLEMVFEEALVRNFYYSFCVVNLHDMVFLVTITKSWEAILSRTGLLELLSSRLWNVVIISCPDEFQ